MLEYAERFAMNPREILEEIEVLPLLHINNIYCLIE